MNWKDVIGIYIENNGMRNEGGNEIEEWGGMAAMNLMGKEKGLLRPATRIDNTWVCKTYEESEDTQKFPSPLLLWPHHVISLLPTKKKPPDKNNTKQQKTCIKSCPCDSLSILFKKNFDMHFHPKFHCFPFSN